MYVDASQEVNVAASTEHRRILNLWLIVAAAGFLLFGTLFALSYLILNAPSVANDATRYRSIEATLGFSELAGLALAVVSLLRYSNLKSKNHEGVFKQLVADNGWKEIRQYKLSSVASILLGTGSDYEERYAFGGTFDNHPFSCLVFEYVAGDSQTCRFICLTFKLSKAYPMIILDNRLNDHGYRRVRSDLPDRVPNGTPLHLEGDFGTYYHVSTTKGSEREAVQVLSPDVMAVLEDAAPRKVDIELSDKELYLILEGGHYTEHNITALFNVAGAVLGKLDKASKTWLASSKGEEHEIAQRAEAARRKLIFGLRAEILSAIGFLLALIFYSVLMVSRIKH